MKKIIAIIILLTLTQFQIKVEPREVQAQDVAADLGKRFDVRSYTYYADGMNYRIFVLGDGYTSVAIDVINTTKEKLEVQRLELEIARLKKLK